jgi:hypothetical protein
VPSISSFLPLVHCSVSVKHEQCLTPLIIKIKVCGFNQSENHKVAIGQIKHQSLLLQHQATTLEIADGKDQTKVLVLGVPMGFRTNVQVDDEGQEW